MPLQNPRIDDLRTSLALEPHPEGGWFRETYRSEETIAREALPSRFPGDRSFSTAIYYLLPGGGRSRLHRIASDEVWHFYEGGGAVLHLFLPSGEYRPVRLGSGGVFQAVAPAGSWFGMDGIEPGSYALFGCTVAPGFDFTDFELGTFDGVVARFPLQSEIIRSLS